jgi:hypothetical protein
METLVVRARRFGVALELELSDRDPMTIETAEQRPLSTAANPSSSSKQASSIVASRGAFLVPGLGGFGERTWLSDCNEDWSQGEKMVCKVPNTVED